MGYKDSKDSSPASADPDFRFPVFVFFGLSRLKTSIPAWENPSPIDGDTIRNTVNNATGTMATPYLFLWV